MFSAEEAEACRVAYEEQTCDEITGGVVPDACHKTCMTSTM
jgi:hypothetical protein